MTSSVLPRGSTLTGWERYAFWWAQWGHFGVTVFIVLAGYSLALSTTRDGRLSDGMFGYLRRRAQRTAPPYWIALTLTIVLTVLWLHETTGTHWDLSLQSGPKGWIVDYFLLQEVIPVHDASYTFWSVSVEFHIYLLLPLMLVILRWRGLAAAAVFGVGVGAIGMITAAFIDDRAGRFWPAYYLMFAAAAAVCLLVRDHPQVARRVPWRVVSGAGAAALIAVCAFADPHWVESNYLWLDLCAGIATIGLIVAMHLGTASRTAQAMSWRPLAGIAAFAYSIYLIHAPLLQIGWLTMVRPLHAAPLVQLLILWVVLCPVIVAISYGFYRVAEKPFVPSSKRSTSVSAPATTDATVSEDARRSAARTSGATPSANQNASSMWGWPDRTK